MNSNVGYWIKQTIGSLCANMHLTNYLMVVMNEKHYYIVYFQVLTIFLWISCFLKLCDNINNVTHAAWPVYVAI